MITTVSNCRSGELVIQAPQCEIEKFVAEASSWPGVVVQRQGESSNNNIKKPTPLGIPVMNFDREPVGSEKPKAVVQTRRSDGRPQPLGIPVMVFNRNGND